MSVSSDISGSPSVAFPSGSWTLYFHDPADTDWTPDSYKKIGTFSDFMNLWGTLQHIGDAKFLSGMFFLMRDPFVPRWEHRSNIRGGCYCIKIPEALAKETYQRYVATAILGKVAADANSIVGITISPKKGFHILKVWNTESKTFNKPSDIAILGDAMKSGDILYRPHVDQKM